MTKNAKLGGKAWFKKQFYINIIININLILLTVFYFKNYEAIALNLGLILGNIISLVLLSKGKIKSAFINSFCFDSVVILLIPFVIAPLSACLLYFVLIFFVFSSFEENNRKIYLFGLTNISLFLIYQYFCFIAEPKFDDLTVLHMNIAISLNLLLAIYNLSVEININTKNANNILKKSNVFIDKLSEILPDMIYTLDANGNFSKTNYAYEQQVELTKTDLLNKNKKELFEKRALQTKYLDRSQIKNAIDDDSQVLTGAVLVKTGIIKILNTKNEPKFLEYTKLPIKDEKKTITGLICIMHDITEIINKNDTIEKQQTILKQKNEDLKKYISSNLELESFAHIASHDLKTPLRSIGNFSQLLQRSAKVKLNKDELEFLDFIIAGTKSLQQLINDMLKYSLTNNSELQLSEFNVEDILAEVIRPINVTIKESNTEITLKNDSNKKIIADKTNIKQLFSNLILNAIKYRKQYVHPRIQIECKTFNNHFQFCFIDNGIGIDKNYHESIFILLKRLHNNSKYEGTGIGLALCKKIVEKHQGKIWVESAENKGSKFYFTIEKFNLTAANVDLSINSEINIKDKTKLQTKVNTF